jgi:SNF2 family DNA or RNA helicase
MDAQVDLNPHQVEAALFAFKSPLSKGAILADEVGLGKTIEAGILLSQLWAERRKKLLIICPANLRKQWSQELLDKFFLESTILENKNFKRNPPLFWTGCKYTNSDLILLRYSSNGSELCWRATHQG